MTTISVTEVRNALRCPRIFVLGRRAGSQVTFPVGPSSLGATFHRIVARAAETADPPPPRIAALATGSREALIEALTAWLGDELVAEIERSPALATMPSEVDDLAEALRELAGYVGARLHEGGEPAAVALPRFFRASELEVEAVVAGDLPVRLRGRIDALFVPPGDRMEVVEYKLTDHENEEPDVAQVALYRMMLAKGHALDAEAVVLRFTPALSITRVEAERADELVERELLPLIRAMVRFVDEPGAAPPPKRADLCAACPVREACIATYGGYLPSRDDPPAGAARPRPDPAGRVVASAPSPLGGVPTLDRTAREEGDATVKVLDEVFRDLGIGVHLRPPQVGARLVRVEVAAKRGRVKQLDASPDDLRHQLHQRGVAAFYEKVGGQRLIYCERRHPRQVHLAPLLRAEAAWLAQRPGRFVVGERLDGSALRGDLSVPVSAHLLIGGATGSGKSVLLRGIVKSLVHYHPPEAIQLTLVDPKRVSFHGLREGLAAHLAEPICFEAEEAVRILEDLVVEMEDRYARFEKACVEDLSQLNEESGAVHLPRRVVVIDEFQDLMASKATRGPFERAVERLGAKARAAGIHLVLATQHPTVKVVPSSIKANLNGRIALRVQDASASRVILRCGGAEQLLGQGDLVADLGRGPLRAQAPLA